MARSRDIEYRVGFTGDTTELEAAVNKATESLQKLSSTPEILRKGLNGAAQSALELSNHLSSAFNQATGKIDLVKFQQSLNASGKSLQAYARDLSSLGPEGQEAFLNMAVAIGKAELPLRRTNNIVKQFGTTLWNTARWRVTTSAINAVVGGMQQAIGYAKSLDSSLNNIRIVTGKSAEEMAQFAKEANAAAKTLNTTTTTYTDASLIYYQQGLDNEAVRERTNTTIKMANVTGQSAETISSQMTAIWENFDDGSRSLESFADSMVALGATTAASSKEIAEGLQKFAPVAQTVGLSFDYASAALTTIVANTRESASVAGTALKTLFSRIEGLKLGETLDDGTDLNKYSNALMAVGVNIKDVSGNLKNMDTILVELGSKWQTLGKDQQMALAETVAGVRQYAQLVALMDNWGDFQKNLITAQTSQGELSKQAEIYASSWEAARKRVKASTEDIYDSLINPDQFIKLDNLFTPLLTGVASAVDAIGGLTGLLPMVVMLMNNAFGDKIAASLRNMTVNIALMTGAEQKRARALQASVAETASALAIGNEENSVANAKIDVLKREVELQAEINRKYESMPALQKTELENQQQLTNILKEQVLATAERADKMRELIQEAKNGIMADAQVKEGITNQNVFGQNAVSRTNAFYASNNNPIFDPSQIDIVNKLDDSVAGLADKLREVSSVSGEIGVLTSAISGTGKAAEEARQRAIELLNEYGKKIPTNASTETIKNSLHDLANEARAAGGAVKTALGNLGAHSQEIKNLTTNAAGLAGAESTLQSQTDALNSSIERSKLVAEQASSAYVDWADRMVQVGNAASKAAMAIRAISNLGKVFDKDSGMSSQERVSQGLTSIGMLLPTVAMGGRSVWGAVSNRTGLSNARSAYDKALNGLERAKLEMPPMAEQQAITDAYMKNRSAQDLAIRSHNYWSGIANNPKADISDRLKASEKAAAAFEKLNAAKKAAISTDAAYASMQQKVQAAQDGVRKATENVQKGEEAVNKARKASMATMGIYAVAIMAVVAAIVILVRHLQKQEEAQRRIDEANIKAANSAQESREQNQELIDKYRELLSTYKETGEGKEELDTVTKQLADAYGIEGAALASLTGQYDQFTASLKNATKAKLQKDRDVLAQGAVSELSNAKFFKQTKYTLRSRIYNELQNNEVLGRYMTDDQAVGGGSGVFQTSAMVGATPLETLQNLTAAKEELNKLAESSDQGVANFAKGILDKWNSVAGEAIAKAQSLFKEIGVIETEITDPKINNFGEFQKWAETMRSALISTGHAATEAKDIISEAAHNLGFDEWLNIKNIQDDITEQLRYYPEQLDRAQKKLGSIKTLDDAKILAYVPWSLATDKEDELDNLIKRTEIYINTLENGAKAAMDFAKAEELLQKIQSNSALKVKDFDDYIELFGDIDKLKEFLFKSPEERETQLNALIQSNFKESQQQRQASINAINGLLPDITKAKNDALSAIEARANEQQARDIANNVFMAKETYVNSMLTSEQEEVDKWAAARQAVQDYFTELATAEDKQAFKSQDRNKKLIEQWDLDAEDIDLDKALDKVDQEFRKHIDQDVADYNQAKFDEERLLREQDETRDTIEKEQLAYDYETQRQVEQVKNLGELNKILRTRNVSEEVYRKGIIQLAKETPKATKALDAYNKELAKGPGAIKEQEKAFRELVNILRDDALTVAAEKIQTVVAAMQDAEAKIGDRGKMSLADYKKNIQEIADALSEAFGYSVNTDWVEEHGDIVEQLLSDDAQKVQHAAQTMDWSAFWNSDTFKTQAQEMLGDLEKVNYAVELLQGAEINIDGTANLEQIMQQIDLTKLSLSDLANLINILSNANTSFEVTGLEQVIAAMNGTAEPHGAQFTTGDETLDRQIAVMEALAGVSIQSRGGAGMGGYRGGSKGGGGSKKDTKDLKKDLKDIEDRYHEINRQLERQQRLLTELEKQINRTYGTGRLKLYKQQLQEVEKNIELLTRKSEEANTYLQQDKAVLQGLVTDSNLNVKLFEGFDIQFGVGQEIENYNAVLQQIVDLYNAFIDEYEAAIASGDQALIEELEKRKEIEDKLYEARLAALEKYEDSLTNVNTLAHDIADERRKEEDIKLQEITYKMQIVLDIRDARKQFNDFCRDIEESFGDALTHGIKVALVDEKNAREEMAMYEHYLEEYNALKQRLAEANEYTDTTAIVEELKNLESHIIESGEALLEWLEKVENMYVDALEAAAARFERFTNQISHNTEVLGTIKELYQLQGATYKTQEGFDRLQSASQGQYQGYLRQAQLNKQWYESASAKLAEAEKALAGVEETDVRYDALKKNRDALLEEANKAQKAMLENAKAAMETAKQMYLDQIERMSYELEQQLSNGMGFDLMQDKYDHLLEEQDRYLDPVEESLETAAWYTKLQNDIEKTTNKAYQKRLKNLQEEIDLRRENNTLSKYDLDLLNAKYEVLKKQAELEDEQTNKTKVRLVRDSNGNWNYQYTADQGDIAAKEEELLRAKQNEYEITKQRYRELNDEMIKMAQEFAEKDKQIRMDMANGILTEEEGQQRLQELQDYYTKKAEYLKTELDVAEQDMTEAALTSSVLAAGLSQSVYDTSNELVQTIVKTFETVSGPQLLTEATTTMSQLQAGILANITAFETASDGIKAALASIISADSSDGKGGGGNLENLLTQVGTTRDQLVTSLSGWENAFEGSAAEIKGKIKSILEGEGSLGDLPGQIKGLAKSDLFDVLLGEDSDSIAGGFGNMAGEAVGHIEDITDYIGDNFIPTIQNYIPKANDAFQDFKDIIGDTADAIGVDPNNLDDMVQDLTDDIEDMYDEGQDAIEMMWDQLDAIYDLQQAYLDWAKAVEEVINKLKELAAQTVGTIEDVGGGGGGDDDDEKYNAAEDYSLKMAYAAKAGNWDKVQTYANYREQKIAEMAAERKDTSKFITTAKLMDLLQRAFQQDEEDLKQIILAIMSDNNRFFNELASYGTGGYTGTFGSDNSALALLHQKELVLNENDTKNILEAVHIIRGISDTIFKDIADQLDRAGAASMVALGSRLGGAEVPAAETIIEQHVTIEQVNFPGVTSSREIEEAFESLVNDAAQWARRRKS